MMASELEIALGLVAPFYNLILAAIAFILFIKLFRRPNNIVYLKPWKVVFLAFCIYLVEEIFTVLRKMGIVDFPTIMNGIFEMIIISLFIYMLFLQKEYLKKTHHLKTRDDYKDYHKKEKAEKEKKKVKKKKK
jgi:hypothetical protein